jgi:hypothetical protein
VIPLALAFFALIPTRYFQRMYTAILLVPMLAGWWLFFQIGSIAAPPGGYLYIAWPAIFTMTMPFALQFTTRRALIAVLSTLALYLVMETSVFDNPRRPARATSRPRRRRRRDGARDARPGRAPRRGRPQAAPRVAHG